MSTYWLDGPSKDGTVVSPSKVTMPALNIPLTVGKRRRVSISRDGEVSPAPDTPIKETAPAIGVAPKAEVPGNSQITVSQPDTKPEPKAVQNLKPTPPQPRPPLRKPEPPKPIQKPTPPQPPNSSTLTPKPPDHPKPVAVQPPTRSEEKQELLKPTPPQQPKPPPRVEPIRPHKPVGLPEVRKPEPPVAVIKAEPSISKPSTPSSADRSPTSLPSIPSAENNKKVQTNFPSLTAEKNKTNELIHLPAINGDREEVVDKSIQTDKSIFPGSGRVQSQSTDHDENKLPPINGGPVSPEHNDNEVMTYLTKLDPLNGNVLSSTTQGLRKPKSRLCIIL